MGPWPDGGGSPGRSNGGRRRLELESESGSWKPGSTVQGVLCLVESWGYDHCGGTHIPVRVLRTSRFYFKQLTNEGRTQNGHTCPRRTSMQLRHNRLRRRWDKRLEPRNRTQLLGFTPLICGKAVPKGSLHSPSAFNTTFAPCCNPDPFLLVRFESSGHNDNPSSTP